MWLLALGVVVFIWRWVTVGPVYTWNFGDDWWVCVPFVLAVFWWSFADASGYTKRKAMEREEAEKQRRIKRNLEKLHGGRR